MLFFSPKSIILFLSGLVVVISSSSFSSRCSSNTRRLSPCNGNIKLNILSLILYTYRYISFAKTWKNARHFAFWDHKKRNLKNNLLFELLQIMSHCNEKNGFLWNIYHQLIIIVITVAGIYLEAFITRLEEVYGGMWCVCVCLGFCQNANYVEIETN